MIPQKTIDTLTQKVSRSVERMLNDINGHMIETEPNMTDRLLSNIQRDFEPELQEIDNQRIVLSARTLRDRGRNAPENVFGADLATLLDIDLPGYQLRKGFLAQSKWVGDPALEVGASYPATSSDGVHVMAEIRNNSVNLEKSGNISLKNMNQADFGRMLIQCQKMLEITPGSFVFVYTPEDVYVIPATAIVASEGGTASKKYYCKNFKSFMTDYLKSFIGDRSINGIADDDFEERQRNYRANNVLLFHITNQNLR